MSTIGNREDVRRIQARACAPNAAPLFVHDPHAAVFPEALRFPQLPRETLP
jgi:hypothetical protein